MRFSIFFASVYQEPYSTNALDSGGRIKDCT